LGDASDARRGRANDADLPVCKVLPHLAGVLGLRHPRKTL